ncbi:GGDEF domain-containing protein [Lichenibacterium ramalinae]|uniref:Diguanylate cyclase n=1 Tax=Lichenibacterium ramalinae TaxID=2316527 RepID=A0A4V1RIW4_9HYPH|nr:GGDEF domain-containing protein [Lichenibacterium ramalinae]RYB05975.1 diguanylate cyclase [Lichenibacterium ramalinae]
MIAIESIGAPAFLVDVSGNGFVCSAVNGLLTEALGLAPADLVGASPAALVPASLLPAADAAAMLDQYRLCAAERRSVEFEIHHGAPAGGRWWQITVSPVFDGEEGAVVALIGIAVDVTARKADEAQGREVDARIALAMDLLEGGFWHYDVARRRFRTSPQLGRLVTGVETGPLDGKAYAARVLEEDQAKLDIGPLVRGEADTLSAEYRIRTAVGDLRWVSCKRRLTRDDWGRPENVIGVVVDITEQKRREEALAAEAATDSLTGLLNRRGFEALGQHLCADARARGLGFGLVLMDLDRFKPVNDTHGHPMGDAVLCEVAARLRRHTRPGDAAARLGGDEFAILVTEATEDVLAGLSRRLVQAMARPIVTAAGGIEIGASVGAALWWDGDRDLAALTARADDLLFAVKRAGRGAWQVAGLPA